MQTCSVCLIRWPHSCFPRSLTLASGLSRQCKDCSLVRSNLYSQGYGLNGSIPNDWVRLIVRAFYLPRAGKEAAERAAMLESVQNA